MVLTHMCINLSHLYQQYLPFSGKRSLLLTRLFRGNYILHSTKMLIMLNLHVRIALVRSINILTLIRRHKILQLYECKFLFIHHRARSPKWRCTYICEWPGSIRYNETTNFHGGKTIYNCRGSCRSATGEWKTCGRWGLTQSRKGNVVISLLRLLCISLRASWFTVVFTSCIC